MARILADFPDSNFTISSTLNRSFLFKKGRLFESIKNKVMDKPYSLSLVFIGKKRSRYLNRSSRDIDKPTDILSFPLSENSGEIFICPDVAEEKAPKYDRSINNFYGFIFIHGLFHLKGMEHGSRMEKSEESIRKHFNI